MAIDGGLPSAHMTPIVSITANGDRLGEATLNELTVEYTQGCPTGPEAYKISDLTKGKRIVIFALPGAFQYEVSFAEKILEQL